MNQTSITLANNQQICWETLEKILEKSGSIPMDAILRLQNFLEYHTITDYDWGSAIESLSTHEYDVAVNLFRNIDGIRKRYCDGHLEFKG